MNNPIVRNILAVIAGIVLAVLIIGITESAGHAMFPPPEGFDVNDPAAREHLWEVIPEESKAMVAIAWFLGSLVGACAAIAISRHVLPAWIVGLVIAAMGLWTGQLFPHPLWMVVAAAVLPLVAVLVAKLLMVRRLASNGAIAG